MSRPATPLSMASIRWSHSFSDTGTLASRRAVNKGRSMGVSNPDAFRRQSKRPVDQSLRLPGRLVVNVMAARRLTGVSPAGPVARPLKLQSSLCATKAKVTMACPFT
ncbi:hypothetical protein D3C73_1401810 [compost metagenome]